MNQEQQSLTPEAIRQREYEQFCNQYVVRILAEAGDYRYIRVLKNHPDTLASWSSIFAEARMMPKTTAAHLVQLTGGAAEMIPVSEEYSRLMDKDKREWPGQSKLTGEELDELAVGDEVFWNDPEDDIGSGPATITGIVGEIYRLRTPSGGEIEAFRSELS